MIATFVIFAINFCPKFAQTTWVQHINHIYYTYQDVSNVETDVLFLILILRFAIKLRCTSGFFNRGSLDIDFETNLGSRSELHVLIR